MSCTLFRKPVSIAALLTVAAALTLSAILCVWLISTHADKTEEILKHVADTQEAALREEFHHVVDEMNAINRLFSGDAGLSSAQFDLFALNLAREHAFVLALSFVRVVPAEKRPSYEKRMRQARRAFDILEIGNGKTPSADNNARYYHVVEHIAPLPADAKPSGLNFAAMPGKEPAMERARITGRPNATPLFALPPEAGGERVFAVLMPAYRPGTDTGNVTDREDAVLGYSVIVLRAAKLAECAVRRAALPHRPQVDIRIDAGSGDDRAPLYRTGRSVSEPRPASLRRQPAAVLHSVDEAGMRWHIVAAQADEADDDAIAWMVLLGGALVTSLVALFLQSLATRSSDLARINTRLMDDLAARKRIEAALRESEERFHRLADLSSDWYWEQDADLRFTFISGETIFGSMPTRDLIGKARWQLPLEVNQRDFETHLALLNARQPFSDLEYCVRHPNGRLYWMSVSGEPLFGADGKFLGYRGTGKDITGRKEAEQALRQSQTELRELAAHQARVKEDERKRIAREIHDDLGQNLLALRIDVSLLDGATRDAHPALNKSVRALLEQVDNAMRSVRAIMNDLRPAVLDLGLLAAIEWQVQQFRQRTGVSCTLQSDGCDIDGLLDEEAATSVFRILQESLTNVSRHAYASHVEVRIQNRNARFVLEIADDGVGGYPGNMRKPRSFGLIGIRERIHTLDGELRVVSLPGHGTTLTISIPASAKSATAA